MALVKTFFAATALVAAVAGSPASAAALTTIDFNANADNTYFVPTVTSNGFVATGNVRERGNTPLGTNDSIDGRGPNNGTVHLDSWTNYGTNSVWTLTQANGNLFSLKAFDFATSFYQTYAAASLLTLTGTTAGNNKVKAVFVPLPGGFHTFTLPKAFSNLTSVKFDAFGLRNRSAYDNIVVKAASAVPEPATWAMMFLGFGMVGGAARYRRRSTTTAWA